MVTGTSSNFIVHTKVKAQATQTPRDKILILVRKVIQYMAIRNTRMAVSLKMNTKYIMSSTRKPVTWVINPNIKAALDILQVLFTKAALDMIMALNPEKSVLGILLMRISWGREWKAQVFRKVTNRTKTIIITRRVIHQLAVHYQGIWLAWGRRKFKEKIHLSWQVKEMEMRWKLMGAADQIKVHRASSCC